MAANKKKKVIKFEVEKGKLIKMILVVLLVIIICLICFFASSSKSKPYSKSSTTTESSEEDNSVLEQATKEAGKVSDEERTAPKEITISEYMDLYQSEEDSLVLISRPTCQYCKIATPIIENIIYEDNVEIHYLNADNLSDDDTATLVSSDEYFQEGYGTPLLLVVGNSSIKDKVEGLVTKESYQAFFQQYGFME